MFITGMADILMVLVDRLLIALVQSILFRSDPFEGIKMIICRRSFANIMYGNFLFVGAKDANKLSDFDPGEISQIKSR